MKEPAIVVGVRFEPAGRTFDFDAAGLTLESGELVVTEDRAGVEIGTVAVASRRRPVRGYIGRVLRRANAVDTERRHAHDGRIRDALAFARERARERSLPIKVFRAELPSGADRAMFYFSAEDRVDFRELVRDLAAHLQTRIEMRQVGVRDEAKMVGGIGSCGLTLCCTTFLPRFAPVSIKMAKDQGLALNPTKVSGQCGRLKCCLVYEQAAYVEAARKLPKLGKRVETPEGTGRVDHLDTLGGKARISFPDKPPMVFNAADLRWGATEQPRPDEPSGEVSE